MTAVGEDRVACSNLQGRGAHGAERKREISRQTRAVETEALGVGHGRPHAYRLQYADRHQVARLDECFTQARGSAEIAAGVFWPPGFFHARIVDDERRIENER